MRRDEELKRQREDEARKELERSKQAEVEEEEREARRKGELERSSVISDKKEDLRSRDTLNQSKYGFNVSFNSSIFSLYLFILFVLAVSVRWIVCFKMMASSWLIQLYA